MFKNAVHHLLVGILNKSKFGINTVNLLRLYEISLMMFDQLFKSIFEVVSLTEEELELCKSLFQPKKLRKRQYLLQEGDICKYTVFVEKGLLRSYTVDDKGNEHILQFAMEGWWMADLYSFLTNEPSSYHMDAIEDSELLMIDKDSWDNLLAGVPAL